MARMILFILSLAAAAKSSPVAKVIDLLDELTGKVKGDLAAEEIMMEEYTKWCDTESNEKEDAITSAKRTIGDLESEMADATARISELSTEVEELAVEVGPALRGGGPQAVVGQGEAHFPRHDAGRARDQGDPREDARW